MNPQGFRRIWLPTRFAIYARDDFGCLVCGRRGRWRRGRGTWCDARAEALSLDHVVPASLGGQNRPTNLLTVCVACNSARRAEPIESAWPDRLEVIRSALDTPIDPALGRALVLELAPAFARRYPGRFREGRQRS